MLAASPGSFTKLVATRGTSMPSKDSEAIEALKSLLRLVLRISISDGRIFLGTFAGTDKALNLLLVNTDEFRLGPAENPDGRYVGQVMVPWRLVKRVEVQSPGVGPLEQEDGMYI